MRKITTAESLGIIFSVIAISVIIIITALGDYSETPVNRLQFNDSIPGEITQKQEPAHSIQTSTARTDTCQNTPEKRKKRTGKQQPRHRPVNRSPLDEPVSAN